MDWRQAIKLSAHYGLNHLSLFLTGLIPEERQECYTLLRDRQRRRKLTLPFVHARHDMCPDEYRMLMSEFGTERFNLHPLRKTPLPEDGLPNDLRDCIYIENVGKLLESDIDGYAGICVDVAHLEITRCVYPNYFPELCALIEKYPVGASHVSSYDPGKEAGRNDKHRYRKLSEFGYLGRYSPSYFGRYVAIELTNPLSEQLAVKTLLRKHLALA